MEHEYEVTATMPFAPDLLPSEALSLFKQAVKMNDPSVVFHTRIIGQDAVPPAPGLDYGITTSNGYVDTSPESCIESLKWEITDPESDLFMTVYYNGRALEYSPFDGMEPEDLDNDVQHQNQP